jgi:membrane protease YdiL (CAAX protease family)
VFGGALLAPWLYGAAQAAGHYSRAAENIASQPFHRFVNRAMLGLALIGIIPLMRTIGMNSWRALGLGPERGRFADMAAGYAFGFGSFACVAAATVTAGARHWTMDAPQEFATELAGAAFAALIIALLEEVLFRGAVFGSLRSAQPLPLAIVISSAVYALVHFFDRPPAPATVDWKTGFTTVVQMFAGFTEVDRLVPSFFTLLLAGIILAMAYHYTGTLYFSIGLHAGWVFWLKMYRVITTGQGRTTTSFWGTGKMIDGWMAVVIMGILLVGLQAWRRREIRVTNAA